MNSVVYYSNTKQSKVIAEYFANQLEYTLTDIESECGNEYQNLVLVFPVHCQNIPDVVKWFLNKVKVESLSVIATYGKMCPGNVLYEVQQNYHKNIVAAAYIPTKHSYIEEDDNFVDFDKLHSIVAKINNPSYIQLPKRYKNPLANVFPKLRSQQGIKIQKNVDCNECNICAKHCSFNAIDKGVTNNRCIRCLRCVELCPQKALKIKKRFWLSLYFRKKTMAELIIYV